MQGFYLATMMDKCIVGLSRHVLCEELFSFSYCREYLKRGVDSRNSYFASEVWSSHRELGVMCTFPFIHLDGCGCLYSLSSSVLCNVTNIKY